MEQYCPPGTAPFVPVNKISPKLFFATDFLGFLCLYGTRKSINENETKKTNMLMSFINTFCNKNRQTQKFVLNFSVLENKQVRRSFFSGLFMPYNKSFIDQASSVKLAVFWPHSPFALLWTSTSSRSIKTQKENSANIQPS